MNFYPLASLNLNLATFQSVNLSCFLWYLVHMIGDNFLQRSGGFDGGGIINEYKTAVSALLSSLLFVMLNLYLFQNATGMALASTLFHDAARNL